MIDDQIVVVGGAENFSTQRDCLARPDETSPYRLRVRPADPPAGDEVVRCLLPVLRKIGQRTSTHSCFDKISDAFVPPKPKDFYRTCSTFICRALLGT